MSRSLDLLLQSSTRSRCHARKNFSCNLRHAPDVTPYRSSLAICDTLPMSRSKELTFECAQCHRQRPEQNEIFLGTGTQRLPGLRQKQLLAVRLSSRARRKKRVRVTFLDRSSSSNAHTHTHNSFFMNETRINHTIHQKRCTSL